MAQLIDEMIDDGLLFAVAQGDQEGPALPRPLSPAATAVENYISQAHREMPLAELLAAILRRAERGRSYGHLMTTSKDTCLDDVISLARAALGQVSP